MKSRTKRFLRNCRPVAHIHPYIDRQSTPKADVDTILIMAGGVVYSTSFDKTLVDNYTRARIGGKWYSVDHITTLSSSPALYAWLESEHGVISGYVEAKSVEAWESV